MNDMRGIQHAIILAAGRGNRMRPLTDVIPKAMLPYKGDTLIGNSLSMLKHAVKYIHVTVGYKSAMLSQYLLPLGISSIINTEGHSNSWWIKNTLLQSLNEPALVLTCDNITELDIQFLISEYHRINAPACMVVPVVPIPMIDGDYIDHEDGVVTRIQRQEARSIYCSGIQVINPNRVAALITDDDQDSGFYSVWGRLIEYRQLGVSQIYPNTWFSVDTLDQLANLPE